MVENINMHSSELGRFRSLILQREGEYRNFTTMADCIISLKFDKGPHSFKIKRRRLEVNHWNIMWCAGKSRTYSRFYIEVQQNSKYVSRVLDKMLKIHMICLGLEMDKCVIQIFSCHYGLIGTFHSKFNSIKNFPDI